MKKYIIVFLLAGLSILGSAQVKEVPISDSKIGMVNCQYNKSINLDRGDTNTYISLSFQNAKYSTITDIKLIMFMTTKDSTDVFDFIKDLKSAFADMGTKTSISWERKKYSLILYKSSDPLFLTEPNSKGNGFTTLTKKQVVKLIDWFESIGFKRL